MPDGWNELSWVLKSKSTGVGAFHPLNLVFPWPKFPQSAGVSVVCSQESTQNLFRCPRKLSRGGMHIRAVHFSTVDSLYGVTSMDPKTQRQRTWLEEQNSPFCATYFFLISFSRDLSSLRWWLLLTKSPYFVFLDPRHAFEFTSCLLAQQWVSLGFRPWAHF